MKGCPKCNSYNISVGKKEVSSKENRIRAVCFNCGYSEDWYIKKKK